MPWRPPRGTGRPSPRLPRRRDRTQRPAPPRRQTARRTRGRCRDRPRSAGPLGRRTASRRVDLVRLVVPAHALADTRAQAPAAGLRRRVDRRLNRLELSSYVLADAATQVLDVDRDGAVEAPVARAK